jgi:hypothetical protein
MPAECLVQARSCACNAILGDAGARTDVAAMMVAHICVACSSLIWHAAARNVVSHAQRFGAWLREKSRQNSSSQPSLNLCATAWLTLARYACRADMGRKGPACCVVSCGQSLAGCRVYNQRCFRCPVHQRAKEVLQNNGRYLRFCHQCGRLELLTAFSGSQRSCRFSLERKRKGLKAAAQVWRHWQPWSPGRVYRCIEHQQGVMLVDATQA